MNRRHLAIAAALLAGAALTTGLLVGVRALAQPSGLSAIRPAVEARYPEVHWTTTDELAADLARPRPPRLLDARAPAEFRVSHIQGATRIDPDSPSGAMAALGEPNSDPIVVYCSVGWRSGDIADRLRQRGFSGARNLEGGIFAWANEGRPVYRGRTRVQQVHPYDETWGQMLRRELWSPL